MKLNYKHIIIYLFIFIAPPGRADQGMGVSSKGKLSSIILVQSPNLPATYYGLEPLTIKWVSRGIDYVRISYSLHSGNWVNYIVDSVEASLGAYEWIVPNTSSDHCLVRVNTYPNFEIYDESDHMFSIVSVTPTDNSLLYENFYDFYMNSAYPNPFNHSTKIAYSIPKSDFVSLKVYNCFGKEIQILVSGIQKAGEYIVDFNAGNLTSGIYFYKLQVGNGYVDMKKMLFIK